MSDLHFSEEEKEYLNQGNRWEGTYGIDPYVIVHDPLDGVTPELWEACKPRLPDSNNFGVPMITGTRGEIDLGLGIYDQFLQNRMTTCDLITWENIKNNTKNK